MVSIKISLYASGRRLNFKNHQIIEKTGLLTIETNPSEAIITLSNGDNDIVTPNFWNKKNTMYSPIKIKNLKPDSYRLIIELAGYWPVQKDLRIFPGQSIFIDNIKLFKKSEALMLLEGETQKITLLSDNKHLLLEGDKKTFSWDKDIIEDAMISYVETLSEKNLVKANIVNNNFSIGQGDNVFYSTNFEIYRLDSRLKSTLIIRSSEEIEGLEYDSDRYLIYSTASEIKMVDLKDTTNTISLLKAKDIKNIILKSDRSLYFSSNINGLSGLYKLSIK
jgi:hypothetical protein